MGWLDLTWSIATVIVAIVLTIVIMLQNEKGPSSSNGSSNTFYGANKSKTLDGVLSKWTIALAVIFCILCVCTTISIMH